MSYQYVRYRWPDGQQERHIRVALSGGEHSVLCGRDTRLPPLPPENGVYTIKPNSMLLGECCRECAYISYELGMPWEFFNPTLSPNWGRQHAAPADDAP